MIAKTSTQRSKKIEVHKKLRGDANRIATL
jgi:hypothetical protein